MQETYSHPTETPSFRREDLQQPQPPNNSESSRRSLWRRRRGPPIADRPFVNAQHFGSDWRTTHETGSAISSSARGASRKNDIPKILNLRGRRTSIADSEAKRQSSGSKCEIMVSTNILRESSDSAGTPMEDPRVETTVSSPRHKSINLEERLSMPSQRKSPNLNRPTPSTPINTQPSPTESTSSRRSSVMSRVHRLSSRTSASYPSPRTGPIYTPTGTTWLAHDTSFESPSQSKPSSMSSPPNRHRCREEWDASWKRSIRGTTPPNTIKGS